MIKSRDLLIYLAVRYAGDYDAIIAAIRAKEHVIQAAVEDVIANVKSQTCTILDDDYPESFKNIYKPPLVLFYYGKWSLTSSIDNNIAVIGTRKASSYGQEMCAQITAELCQRGQVIVSGLAQGIDACAHATAIKHGGQTIAVLGSGIERCYPEKNLQIYQEIKDHHLLLSEYPAHTPPDAEHFPVRNRLVAALSRATFVAEAHERSGTLITVSQALTQGKDVFCLPYQAGAKSICNQLIKEGAYLVETADDILATLSPERTADNRN